MQGEFIIRWCVKRICAIGNWNLYWHAAQPSYAARKHGESIRWRGRTKGCDVAIKL